MNREIKDIAMWEENDSELAKYTIQKLSSENYCYKSYLENIEQVNKYLYKRIDKAIEYIEELISDTNGLITAYKYEDKEETIKRYIEDLKTDIKHYEYLEDILRGEKDD